MLLAVPVRATDKLFAFFRPFLYFLAALPFTGVAFLLAFKGSCHHSPHPGRQKVQQIRSTSWYEMHHETCLRIKLLMTIAIKNLLPQMHFSSFPDQQELVLCWNFRRLANCVTGKQECLACTPILESTPSHTVACIETVYAIEIDRTCRLRLLYLNKKWPHIWASDICEKCPSKGVWNQRKQRWNL